MREKNYHLPLGPSHDGPGVLYIRLGSRFQLYSLKKLTNSRLIRIKTKDDQVQRTYLKICEHHLTITITGHFVCYNTSAHADIDWFIFVLEPHSFFTADATILPVNASYMISFCNASKRLDPWDDDRRGVFSSQQQSGDSCVADRLNRRWEIEGEFLP